MKSSFLLSILAVIPAAIMPLAVAGQVAPERTPSQGGAPVYKWEASALAGYTSLNQVNQSRYGLIGGKFGVTRDFGRGFGLTAIGDYYKPPTGTGNPGHPYVYSAFAGAEFRANLYGNFDGFLHGLMGVEQYGGEGMTPNISFAGGFGGGMLYNRASAGRFAPLATGSAVFFFR